MLNRSNVGVFFDKTKGQLESIIKDFKDRASTDDYIFQKGSAKFFSNLALAELLEEEKFKIKKTQIISVANQKGGVGKTSTILAQARNLSDLGFKVLVLDTDAQSNTTKSLTGRKGSVSFYDMIERDLNPSEVIINIRDGFDLIPANDNCSRIDLTLSDPKFTYNPSEFIGGYFGGFDYDFILIDTNPSFSSINIACIASSDRVICPVPLCEWEIDGVEQVTKIVNGINERLKTDIKLDFLVTKFSKNESTAFHEISKIKNLDGNLLKTLIPLATAFRKAQKTGALENKGKAYKETLKLTREIVENCSRVE